MSRKIVGMITGYLGLTQSDWLWQQTPHPFGMWGNIQMLKNAPNPDFLLMYQFNFYEKISRKRSWLNRLQKSLPDTVRLVDVHSQLRGVSKERIMYLLREPPLDEIVNKNKANYEIAKQYCSYVSGPDDFAPIPNYMPAIWYHTNSFQELDEMKPPPKEKRLSWVTSGINRTASHRQRLAFLKQLCLSEVPFDLYGRNLPSWAVTSGELSNKWHGMAPYYYNLAIENYAENSWYVSEKLWDSLLAWCLPIYYGGTAVEQLLPPGSFLRLPSLDEKGISYIQDVITTPDAWHEAKSAIREARAIILHKLNLLNWLSDFVDELS